jgi:peptide/nickel transport system substrate-binding protein
MGQSLGILSMSRHSRRHWPGPAPGAPRTARPGLAALAGLLAVLAACEGPPARSKPWRHAPDPDQLADLQPSSEILAAEAARTATRRRRSHTLRIYMDRIPRHLNPMVAPSEWTLRIAADTVFETLIRYQPPPGGAGTGPGQYQPGLARSWTVAQGGREIRLELMPDVSFHDGARMSSVDVQFSLDAARTPRFAADHLRAQLADVVAVELLGPRSVRIRLARPNGYVLRALAEVPILPAHVYENRLSPQRGPVVGTGPYRLESWDEELVRLTRFDRYRGQAPAIPNIEFVYVPDAAQALTMAKRGEIDIVPALIRAHYPEQASAPGLARAFAPLRLRPPALHYLALNASKPPLDDVRVRQAIALLIDRKTLIKEEHDGLARPVAGPVWPGGPGDGPASGAPSYDPARAGALLDAADWRDRDGDGVREQGQAMLRFTLLVGGDGAEPAESEAAGPGAKGDQDERERIVRSLRRSGILIDRRAGPPAVLSNRLRAGDFDLAFVLWQSAVDQDLAPLLESGGALNFGRFSHPRVDAVLASLRNVWEPAMRAPRIAELGQVLAETWPMAPIVAPDPYGLIHRRVQGAVVWNGWIVLRALSLASEPDDADQDQNGDGAAAASAGGGAARNPGSGAARNTGR